MTKKQIIWTVVVVSIVLIVIYRKNIAGFFGKQVGAKCCMERDLNCKCVRYEYKKSEDCSPVPCPKVVQRTVITSNPIGTPVPTDSVGGGRPMPIGTIK